MEMLEKMELRMISQKPRFKQFLSKLSYRETLWSNLEIPWRNKTLYQNFVKQLQRKVQMTQGAEYLMKALKAKKAMQLSYWWLEEAVYFSQKWCLRTMLFNTFWNELLSNTKSVVGQNTNWWFAVACGYKNLMVSKLFGFWCNRSLPHFQQAILTPRVFTTAGIITCITEQDILHKT